MLNRNKATWNHGGWQVGKTSRGSRDARHEERESKTVQREYVELSSDKQQIGSAVVLHYPVNAA
jgi:hypothetical protein